MYREIAKFFCWINSLGSNRSCLICVKWSVAYNSFRHNHNTRTQYYSNDNSCFDISVLSILWLV